MRKPVNIYQLFFVQVLLLKLTGQLGISWILLGILAISLFILSALEAYYGEKWNDWIETQYARFAFSNWNLKRRERKIKKAFENKIKHRL